MREAAFVKQNKNKWTQFEQLLNNKRSIAPATITSMYLEVTDDLSYAKTFYPGSNTTTYLNGLAATAHQKIYTNKKEPGNVFWRFYAFDFPLMFFRFQKQLLLSFIIFSLFIAVGVFSASSEGVFVRAILGDAYINMTLENIANQDPMAVYKQMGEVDMFLGITVNNIRVALMAYTLGILAGVGTVYVLMQNAIMLGAFQYFFFENGMLWESARTIWIHGTIEISVIIIAGCAGLVVGKSILFPQTYTRLASFIKGVKNGLKIVLSTIPFFIIAGFLEGFVTRQTQMPDWLAITIIGISLLSILLYYVYYPIHLNKKLNTNGKQLVY
ncbi:stage II sporulation protein M [Antarcticibacterium arcticum]|uniref:Stage II sporulation protein M n=1 Tax=Antarcticibacterium arcticum TaxID=2585771 RepID=A0A5B8YKZ6_9FLAO|nr:stage II sporulation protein M [Antarcticibacterium arcticum]QED37303.1 stage II sporulation protein M [Antarcticibacterium arcticum]